MIAGQISGKLRRLLSVLPVVLLFALGNSGSLAARLEVPADFLASDSAKVRKALEGPVSGDFLEAKIREVLDRLAQQSRINIDYGGAALPEGKDSRFSGSFTLPFRLAVYEALMRTRCGAVLKTRQDGSVYVKIVNK